MKPPPPAANPADFGKLGISRMLRGTTSVPKLLQAADSVDEAVEVLARVLLGKRTQRVVKTPDGGEVIIHRRWLRHIVSRRRQGKGGSRTRDERETFAHFILPTLENPDEIWLIGKRKRFIKVFVSQGRKNKGFLAVTDQRADGFLLWTAYRLRGAKDMNKKRIGTLLYSREKATSGGQG